MEVYRGVHENNVSVDNIGNVNNVNIPRHEHIILNSVLKKIGDENLFSYDNPAIERVMNYHKITKGDQMIVLKHCQKFTDVELT